VRLLRPAFSTHSPQLEPIKTHSRRGDRFIEKVTLVAGRAHGAADPVFVGREVICGELDARVSRAATEGEMEIIVLHGRAGIGKSATLTRLLSNAAMLWLACVFGRVFSPGPWISACKGC